MAAQSGSTVRLIELKALAEEDIPLDFFSFSFSCKNFEIPAINNMKIFSTKGEYQNADVNFVDNHRFGKVNVMDRLFSYENKNLSQFIS